MRLSKVASRYLAFSNYAYYMVTSHEDILLLGVRQYPYIEAAACLGIGLLSVLFVPVHHSLF